MCDYYLNIRYVRVASRVPNRLRGLCPHKKKKRKKRRLGKFGTSDRSHTHNPNNPTTRPAARTAQPASHPHGKHAASQSTGPAAQPARRDKIYPAHPPMAPPSMKCRQYRNFLFRSHSRNIKFHLREHDLYFGSMLLMLKAKFHCREHSSKMKTWISCLGALLLKINYIFSEQEFTGALKSKSGAWIYISTVKSWRQSNAPIYFITAIALWWHVGPGRPVVGLMDC